jgi:hypothetical protein
MKYSYSQFDLFPWLVGFQANQEGTNLSQRKRIKN